MGPDGFLRHCYGGKAGSGDLALHTPCYTAVAADNHVLVADNDNGRIVLLNSALEFVRYILDFHEPHRLYLDSSAGRLYVGECSNGNIKVFQFVYQGKWIDGRLRRRVHAPLMFRPFSYQNFALYKFAAENLQCAHCVHKKVSP